MKKTLTCTLLGCVVGFSLALWGGLSKSYGQVPPARPPKIGYKLVGMKEIDATADGSLFAVANTKDDSRIPIPNQKDMMRAAAIDKLADQGWELSGSFVENGTVTLIFKHEQR